MYWKRDWKNILNVGEEYDTPRLFFGNNRISLYALTAGGWMKIILQKTSLHCVCENLYSGFGFSIE